MDILLGDSTALSDRFENNGMIKNVYVHSVLSAASSNTPRILRPLQSSNYAVLARNFNESHERAVQQILNSPDASYSGFEKVVANGLVSFKVKSELYLYLLKIRCFNYRLLMFLINVLRTIGSSTDSKHEVIKTLLQPLIQQWTPERDISYCHDEPKFKELPVGAEVTCYAHLCNKVTGQGLYSGVSMLQEMQHLLTNNVHEDYWSRRLEFENLFRILPNVPIGEHLTKVIHNLNNLQSLIPPFSAHLAHLGMELPNTAQVTTRFVFTYLTAIGNLNTGITKLEKALIKTFRPLVSGTSLKFCDDPEYWDMEAAEDEVDDNIDDNRSQHSGVHPGSGEGPFAETLKQLYVHLAHEPPEQKCLSKSTIAAFDVKFAEFAGFSGTKGTDSTTSSNRGAASEDEATEGDGFTSNSKKRKTDKPSSKTAFGKAALSLEGHARGTVRTVTNKGIKATKPPVPGHEGEERIIGFNQVVNAISNFTAPTDWSDKAQVLPFIIKVLATVTHESPIMIVNKNTLCVTMTEGRNWAKPSARITSGIDNKTYGQFLAVRQLLGCTITPGKCIVNPKRADTWNAIMKAIADSPFDIGSEASKAVYEGPGPSLSK